MEEIGLLVNDISNIFIVFIRYDDITLYII